MPRVRAAFAVGIWLTCCVACFELPTDAARPGDDTAGDDDDAETAKASIHIDPLLLNYGQVPAGTTATLFMTLTSTGQDTLLMEELFIEGPMQFDIHDGETERILAPGEETALWVSYTPLGHESADGLLHIMTNDGATPDATVALAGAGMAGSIELDPELSEFGDVPMGCVQEQPITIRNVGNASLEIQEVLFSSATQEMWMDFEFDLGHQLLPGATIHVTVYYEPTDEVTDLGYLLVYSNDPAQPAITAELIGSGIPGGC